MVNSSFQSQSVDCLVMLLSSNSTAEMTERTVLFTTVPFVFSLVEFEASIPTYLMRVLK